MIVKWMKNTGGFSPEERLLNVVYDMRVVRRSDIPLLLPDFSSWKFQSLFKDTSPLFEKLYYDKKAYCLQLNAAGLRKVQRMRDSASDSLRTVVKMQFTHQLQINDIFLRYIRANGIDKVVWYSSGEAMAHLDYVHRLSSPSSTQNGIKVIPDAAMQIAGGKFFWIEYDNDTEWEAQIVNKYRHYNLLMSSFHESYKVVIWVTPSEARTQYMRRLWEARIERKQVDMRFFTVGEEIFD